MEKYYSFAGVDFSVEMPQEKMYTNERLLAPFAVEKRENRHRFVFEITDMLTAPKGDCITLQAGFRVYDEGEWTVRYFGAVNNSWESAYARAAHCGKMHYVQLLSSTFADKVGVKTVLNCMEAEHLVTEQSGFVFHCSYIDIGGRAVLFTAPSGVGKSTQAELWKTLRGAETVNGDRAVIRCTDSGVIACGIPFAGSSDYCLNRNMPIAAIVYLEQAPETKIRRLSGYEAFSKIWEGCSVNIWEKRDMEIVSKLVETAAQNVPVFHLACTPDESAVTALENALAEVKHSGNKK